MELCKLVQRRNIKQVNILYSIYIVTIFDWDDTILCTTYLGSYGFIDLPSEVTE